MNWFDRWFLRGIDMSGYLETNSKGNLSAILWEARKFERSVTRMLGAAMGAAIDKQILASLENSD